jgi:hypothetical protein
MTATTKSGPAALERPGPGSGKRLPMQRKANRRSYGTGSLFSTARADSTRVYYGSSATPPASRSSAGSGPSAPRTSLTG